LRDVWNKYRSVVSSLKEQQEVATMSSTPGIGGTPFMPGDQDQVQDPSDTRSRASSDSRSSAEENRLNPNPLSSQPSQCSKMADIASTFHDGPSGSGSTGPSSIPSYAAGIDDKSLKIFEGDNPQELAQDFQKVTGLRGDDAEQSLVSLVRRRNYLAE
jgi:hypothetical protein